ncbi:hypothetical protein ACLI4U_13600 [Natrialbaceae archaeon A-CW2]
MRTPFNEREGGARPIRDRRAVAGSIVRLFDYARLADGELEPV